MVIAPTCGKTGSRQSPHDNCRPEKGPAERVSVGAIPEVEMNAKAALMCGRGYHSPMPSVVPAPFLFRFALPVHRVADLPRDSAPWLKLPESCRLVNAGALGNEPQFADLRAAWNPDGL